MAENINDKVALGPIDTKTEENRQFFDTFIKTPKLYQRD